MVKTVARPVSSGSIQSFFNGTAKAKRTPSLVSCPVSRLKVDQTAINKHLDSGDCVMENGDIPENSVENKSVKSNPSVGTKRKVSEDPPTEVNRKKLKEDQAIKDFNNDSDDDALADLFSDKDFPDASQHTTTSSSQPTPNKDFPDASQPTTTSSSQPTSNNDYPDCSQHTPSSSQPTIILSGSISYNPARFGGLASLTSPKKGSQLVRSHSFTAQLAKFGPPKTPTKNKRGRDPNPAPPFPNHDPFTPSKRSNPEYVPYYVTNFNYILGCVIDCTSDKDLFTDNELDLIDSYRGLSLSAKKMYVRLFNRKHAWVPEGSIRYEEIPQVAATAEELVEKGFLDNKEKLDDLLDMLDLLGAAQVKSLAKEFNCCSKNSSKRELIPELLKMSSQKSAMNSFFQKGPSSSTLESKMINKGKALVGPCYKLNSDCRSVFLRVLCLWGLNSWWESQEDGQAPSSLTAILLTNQGKIIFPQYSIRREARLFRDRDDLIAFEEAVTLESRLETAMANKEFEEGFTVFGEIREAYAALDDAYCSHVIRLPVFLRRFSALAVLVVGLSKSVDLLEKMRKYEEAVDLLGRLLAGNGAVLARYRGHWYERLSLDLDSHLKNPTAALATIEAALNDSTVKPHRKLTLMQRAVKICGSKRNKCEEHLMKLEARDDWDNPEVGELPTREIGGKQVDKAGGQTQGKSVFQVTTLDDAIKFCSVEELVKDFYSDEMDLPEGLHAEGAVFNSMLGLLFWDEIYNAELSDVFRDPGQSMPLDWDTDHFFLARREALESRLAQLSEMDREEMVCEVERVFTMYQGVSSMVSWTYWPTSSSLCGLVRCMEPSVLCQVLGRMIRDHRGTRSGLPDLTVWNTQTREIRLVEVKGPGDRLSTKQIIWIRFLNQVGLPCEVCRVVPTGSKGLRYNTKSPVKKGVEHQKFPQNTKSPVKKKVEHKKSPQKNTKSPVKNVAKTKLGKKQGPPKKDGNSDIITYDSDEDPDFVPPVKVGGKKRKTKSSVKKETEPKPVRKQCSLKRGESSAIITSDEEAYSDIEPPVKKSSRKGRRRHYKGERVRKPPEEDQED